MNEVHSVETTGSLFAQQTPAEDAADRVVVPCELLENLESWFVKMGFSDGLAQFAKVAVAIIAIIVLAILANYIARKVIIVGLTRLSRKTKSVWGNLLAQRNVFHKLSHLAPALVIQGTIGIALYEYHPGITETIERLTFVYITIAWMVVLAALVEALHDIYLTFEHARTHPLKGYVQIAKILIYVLGTITIISLLAKKDPLNLLLGMGASAALLMLIFKDTIMGFVASVQVSANNMVKPGDWIEMPSRNADGIVTEISLYTVKVQNWDRTISTIPTYALVSESFTNWKGMEESDGRRIKRSVFIDMRSTKFCSPALLEKLRKIYYLEDYIDRRTCEIEEYNRQMGFDESTLVNGRRLTNLGLFRKYLENYLDNHPKVNTSAIRMVRQLQPTERGIPIEIYCFSKEKSWVQYEGIQADMFDHILTIIPEFELSIFQDPSGDDFQKIIQPKT